MLMMSKGNLGEVREQLREWKVGDIVDHEPKASRPFSEADIRFWLMLRLHPNHDLKVERQLQANGIPLAYVPKEKLKIRVTWGRYTIREVPIFAGTLFVPDFEGDIARLKRVAEGIGGFVRNGKEALRVSPLWMGRIRAFEAKRQGATGERRFHVGQQVRVTGGLYDMWEGKINRLDRRQRLVVLIETIRGAVKVHLDEDQVEAI